MSLPCQFSASSNLTTNSNFFPRVVSIPVSTLKFSRVPGKHSRNENCVSRRRGICVKSADSDASSDGNIKKSSQANIAGSDGGNAASSRSFLSVLCPLLKLFSGGDPSRERNQTLEVATSSLASFARLPWGSRALPRESNVDEIPSIPPLRLQLFEFEACPFCRRVREAMTELDLSVEVYPCPKGSVRHREMVRRSGGKEQFPFLVDPNTGTSLYESGWMPTILRAGRGMTLWEKAIVNPPQKMLEVFSYENNLHARIVREALCELELPYVLHNVGEGSVRRQLLVNASGSDEVPYLIDPNTGTQIGDYKKIIAYLFNAYSVATV